MIGYVLRGTGAAISVGIALLLGWAGVMRIGIGLNDSSTPGIAVGAILLVACFALLAGAERLARRRPKAELHKQCPDCAEAVKREAVVCRHCRYRFETV